MYPSTSLAGNLRGYETQASISEAFSGRTSWTPSQMKAILLCYCEAKLAASGGGGRFHLAEKLATIEENLKRNSEWRRRDLMPGLEGVFIEVRYELNLRPSHIFRPGIPPPAASSSSSSSRTPGVVRESSYGEGGGGGVAPPPAWTPRRGDDPALLLPEDDLARAMRESLLFSPSSIVEEPLVVVAPPLPQTLLPPHPFSSSSRQQHPTFRSTYLSFPLPTLSSPTPTFNDPLNLITSSNYQTLFLIDDSPSLDWPAARDAVSRLVPLVSLLTSSSSEVTFVWSEEIEGNCGTGEAVRELMERAKAEGKEPTGRERRGCGLGRRLEGALGDYLRDLEDEEELERLRRRRGRGEVRERVEGEEERHDASRERREKIRPLIVILVTDGTSSDDLESTLVSATQCLERIHAPQGQLGVFFLQIGNEPLARKYLRSLSKLRTKFDSLGREISDTTIWILPSSIPLTGDSRSGLREEGQEENDALLLRKILLGSINRRVSEVDLDDSLM